MFSKSYNETLLKSIEFQNKSLNWSGGGSYQYVDQLRDLIKQYDCKSMLDYGCGKGEQYTGDEVDFAKLIGIESYDLHDPAYEKFKELPKGKWDLTICLDVLPFIPEEDISTVKDLILSLTNKVCVIGLHSDLEVKRSKKPFVCIRDTAWWEDKLRHEKIKIVWIGPQEPFDVEKFIDNLKSSVF
jgi:hypothetical protein